MNKVTRTYPFKKFLCSFHVQLCCDNMDITGTKLIYNNATVIGIFCCTACLFLLDYMFWINKIVFYCIFFYGTCFCHNLLKLTPYLKGNKRKPFYIWEWGNTFSFCLNWILILIIWAWIQVGCSTLFNWPVELVMFVAVSSLDCGLVCNGKTRGNQ